MLHWTFTPACLWLFLPVDCHLLVVADAGTLLVDPVFLSPSTWMCSHLHLVTPPFPSPTTLLHSFACMVPSHVLCAFPYPCLPYLIPSALLLVLTAGWPLLPTPHLPSTVLLPCPALPPLHLEGHMPCYNCCIPQPLPYYPLWISVCLLLVTTALFHLPPLLDLYCLIPWDHVGSHSAMWIGHFGVRSTVSPSPTVYVLHCSSLHSLTFGAV